MHKFTMMTIKVALYPSVYPFRLIHAGAHMHYHNCESGSLRWTVTHKEQIMCTTSEIEV